MPPTVQYDVTFDLKGTKRQPQSRPINIPSGDYIDLASLRSVTPEPGTVVIVSSEDRILAQEARIAAEESSVGASVSLANAVISATEAAASASSASQSKNDAAEAAQIAVMAEAGAVAARISAEEARDSAQGSATIASTGASSASSSATAAASSATNAATAATNATVAKTGAEAVADTATQEASAAASSATAAATSATAAAASATAAQTARDTTLAAAILELRGTGFPGSTTETNNAPVGTYYTDTAGTNGAWRWLKTTAGSGISRWSVLFGSVSRNLGDADLNGDWTASTGSTALRLTRGDSVVSLVGIVNLTDGLPDLLMTLPKGFRPVKAGIYGQHYRANTTAAKSVRISTNGDVTLFDISTTFRGPVHVTAVFPAPPDWPATLPGLPG